MLPSHLGVRAIPSNILRKSPRLFFFPDHSQMTARKSLANRRPLQPCSSIACHFLS